MRRDDARGSFATGRRRRPRLAGRGVALGILVGTWAAPALPETAVNLELLLAVDASGSVDGNEFVLQLQGLAEAFRDPEVSAAIAAHAPAGAAVGLMQWAGRAQQVMALDWTLLRDAASAQAFGGAIARLERRVLGETAIADALALAIEQLERNRFAGARRVIDVSGDGPSNVGGPPGPVRDAAVALGITINGLAIVNETPVLDLYYGEHVIGGPGAFTMVAKDFSDFADAMRRKLLREIEGTGVAARETAPGRLAVAAATGTGARDR